MNANTKKRETELDILRLLAMLAVIFTHACGIEANSDSDKNVMTFLAATVTWHVPVFVMISGRFFLDPTRNLSSAKLCKAIRRLVTAFVFWNVIYQCYYIAAGTYSGLNWKGILSQVLIGPYHFWYLFMLVCLYAITPFLWKITEDKKLMEYFITLFLIFEFLTMYGPNLPLIGTTVGQIVTKSNFHFALGYSGYYILGYYLHRHPLSGRKEIGLYCLGIGMLLFTGFATVWNTNRGAAGEEWFSKYLMPNVILEAAAIYTLFVNRVRRISFSRGFAEAVRKLAGCSFGVYLVHALVFHVFDFFRFGKIFAGQFLAVITAVILCFCVSMLIAALLRKIPYLGKRIT